MLKLKKLSDTQLDLVVALSFAIPALFAASVGGAGAFLGYEAGSEISDALDLSEVDSKNAEFILASVAGVVALGIGVRGAFPLFWRGEDLSPRIISRN